MKKGTKKIKSQTSVLMEGSIEALKEQIERLEMENAYQKKLNALLLMQEKLQINEPTMGNGRN
ncbi:hypothetical protein [Pseudobacillus wudalianchiensis]|uniref:Uncharacterized protein n=1 Tax=Pseudobacillus wudalianchiensis TaxID=1743143 RepID=A0A1B9AYR6_9BACI|nr:hypothetical protein [Bacillus wudalianchiensis]OCA88878.1 hypothetical protein A8F95_05455 [Bacillus wudalianchiensis]